MSFTLPPVGTNRLLELLSPYAPDDFAAEIYPRNFTDGRRHDLSAAQLWRTHLLAGLTADPPPGERSSKTGSGRI